MSSVLRALSLFVVVFMLEWLTLGLVSSAGLLAEPATGPLGALAFLVAVAIAALAFRRGRLSN